MCLPRIAARRISCHGGTPPCPAPTLPCAADARPPARPHSQDGDVSFEEFKQVVVPARCIGLFKDLVGHKPR
jgi:hypothetical protein